MSEPDTPTNYDGHEDKLTRCCKKIKPAKWGVNMMKVFGHICNAGIQQPEDKRDTLARAIEYIDHILSLEVQSKNLTAIEPIAAQLFDKIKDKKLMVLDNKLKLEDNSGLIEDFYLVDDIALTRQAIAKLPDKPSRLSRLWNAMKFTATRKYISRKFQHAGRKRTYRRFRYKY